ncbi:MAG: ComEC/Rec2 family competence protein [Simkaniaceae bacterium]|nr:ComEC/Rec2 family competence protein [Simkaniaceae bacterium]MCF7852123.1 ComEC/Rec2 family competence protein [Simkaniaceae bacterium]
MGLAIVFGCYFAFYFNPWLIISFLCFAAMAYHKMAIVIVLTGMSYCYTHFLYPHYSFESVNGYAHLHIQELELIPTHYGSRYRMKGELLHFQSQGDERIELNQQPVIIYGKQLEKIRGQDLLALGTLIQYQPHRYLFQIKWHQDKGGAHFFKKQFAMKQLIKRWMHRHMKHAKAADFNYILLTGDHINLSIRMLFNRLGLGHLLAISGFHFSVLIGLLSLLLKKMDKRTHLILLMIFATLYFGFTGQFASVKRAYIMALVLLIADLFSLRSNALNTLGACAAILLIYDPFLALQLGFQLSFLACFSLLLFYAPMEIIFSKLLIKRTSEEVKSLNPISLIAYILNSLLRKVLVVNASVLVLMLPGVLFLFQKFPLLSLYYNLFMPALIALIFVLLLFSLAIPYLFKVLDTVTYLVLEGLEHFPVSLDYRIALDAMHPGVLVLLLVIPTGFGIWYKGRKEEERRFLYL